jgi:hypothetical protein
LLSTMMRPRGDFAIATVAPAAFVPPATAKVATSDATAADAARAKNSLVQRNVVLIR